MTKKFIFKLVMGPYTHPFISRYEEGKKDYNLDYNLDYNFVYIDNIEKIISTVDYNKKSYSYNEFVSYRQQYMFLYNKYKKLVLFK